MNSIRLHDQCCRIVLDINSWMKNILFVYYYLIVPAIDIAIIYILNEHLVVIRNLVIFITFVLTFNLFVFNYLLSTIGTEAHKCYSYMNTVFVKSGISFETRLKVSNLIERLSGPLIGIYCFDLFPFTNYEFYLFFVNCVSNFLLFFELL